MKGKIGGFYDITLAVSKNEENAPNVKNLLLGKKMTAHCLVTRVPFETVPESEEEQKKLLFDIFTKKVIKNSCMLILQMRGHQTF